MRRKGQRAGAAVTADHRFRSVPVIDTGHRLEGMIARGDILRALEA